MIFASDLDRTLMYSSRAIKEFGRPEGTMLKPVELRDGKWTAFMTDASFSILRELSRQSLFIPVTTRTTEQFKRFFIFEQEISIKYAITANGANILVQGHPMKGWYEHNQKRLHLESVSMPEMLAIMQREGVHLEGERRQAEHLFFYYLLNCLPTSSEKDTIETLVAKYGWRISLQGRKLYFIPNAISKGNALEYIRQFEGTKVFAGAGDSVLDWDFLQHCQHRLVPKHGELAKMVSGTNIQFITVNRGLGAGEEILEQVFKLFSFHN